MIQEKEIKISDLKVNYKLAGKGEKILILHGWGGSSDSWEKVIEILEKKANIICPDFPGFGKSQTPKKAWNLTDFTLWLKEFVEKLNLENFHLLGHSFGGRVAIKFSILFPEKIKSLILCASAGIKRKWGLRERITFCLALIGNAIFGLKILRRFKDKARNIFYSLLRVRDYAKADAWQKETMKEILEEDLFPELSKIKVKTLILWGEKDNICPLSDAKIFHEKIENSRLKILPKVHHSPHLEDPEALSRAIFEFLNL